VAGGKRIRAALSQVGKLANEIISEMGTVIDMRGRDMNLLKANLLAKTEMADNLQEQLDRERRANVKQTAKLEASLGKVKKQNARLTQEVEETRRDLSCTITNAKRDLLKQEITLFAQHLATEENHRAMLSRERELTNKVILEQKTKIDCLERENDKLETNLLAKTKEVHKLEDTLGQWNRDMKQWNRQCDGLTESLKEFKERSEPHLS
jgi:chromosome segregation ATPase